MSRPYGEIVTFYSYKGGTGRSMVLANVGHLLSSTSRAYGNQRVLLIDWDLEAPGLERFFGATSQSTEPTSPGLIDYLEKIAAHYHRQAPGKRFPESMARDPRAVEIFENATKEYPLKRYIGAVDGRPGLWLMHAGRRATGGPASQDKYWEKVRAFDWDRFYHDYGCFFTHFREMLMAEFDYILIDSRTGLTDIGGICTRVMPEKLVLVFAPNHQNIDGVASVATKSIDYRMAARDPRGLTVFPVASRIDAGASTLRTIWWRGGEVRGEQITGYQTTFERLLSKAYKLDRCSLGPYFDATQIPHDSDYAYGEAIAAAIDGTDDKFGIGYACDQIARRLAQSTAPWEDLPQHPGERPGSIFISYRRTDSAAAASALYDDLCRQLGQDRVFLDVGSVGAGTAWATAIDAQLETAAAVIVLIGENWLEPGWESGSSRADDPNDVIRGEIAAALQRELRVIPVLLDGALMPTPAQLPPDIQPLARRQAISLHSSSWDRDVARLTSALLSIIGPARPAEPEPVARRSLWARILTWFRSA